MECLDRQNTCHPCKYTKTCLKGPLKKKARNCYSRQIIAQCRSKVLQNAPREHSAILSTFIKLPFVFKTFVCLFLIGFTVSHSEKFNKSLTLNTSSETEIDMLAKTPTCDKNKREHNMQESQEVSRFRAGDHKAARSRQDSIRKINMKHK